MCGGLGLRDAGYYAIEAMRLEKGYRAMGHELDSAVTPRMTGLAFTVAGQKEKTFWGRRGDRRAGDSGCSISGPVRRRRRRRRGDAMGWRIRMFGRAGRSLVK